MNNLIESAKKNKLLVIALAVALVMVVFISVVVIKFAVYVVSPHEATTTEIETEADTLIDVPEYENAFDDYDDVSEIDLETTQEVTVEKEGIMILKITVGNNWNWDMDSSPQSVEFTDYTVYLDMLDPTTGEVKNYRTFTAGSLNKYIDIRASIIDNTAQAKWCFDDDYKKMAVTVNMGDGSRHVGWVNLDGDFTDVSEKVTTVSEFSGVIMHTGPYFGNNGYFYYHDGTSVKRVPVDNLNESAVEDMQETWKRYFICPNGSVSNATSYYYDSNMKYEVSNISDIFYDWISEREFVGQGESRYTNSTNDMIYRYTLNGDESVLYPYSEKIALIPRISGRRNCQPIVSPDKSQIAFLSALTTSTDNAPYLFIAPLGEEEEPKRVQTSYSFSPSELKSNLGYSKEQTWLLGWY